MASMEHLIIIRHWAIFPNLFSRKRARNKKNEEKMAGRKNKRSVGEMAPRKTPISPVSEHAREASRRNSDKTSANILFRGDAWRRPDLTGRNLCFDFSAGKSDSLVFIDFCAV